MPIEIEGYDLQVKKNNNIMIAKLHIETVNFVLLDWCGDKSP